MANRFILLGREMNADPRRYFPDATPGCRVEVMEEGDDSGKGSFVVRDRAQGIVFERDFRDGQLGAVRRQEDARQTMTL